MLFSNLIRLLLGVQGIRDAMLQLTGSMVCLSAPACELVHRLRRLFFLNEGQDFSRFLVLPYVSLKISCVRMYASSDAGLPVAPMRMGHRPFILFTF